MSIGDDLKAANDAEQRVVGWGKAHLFLAGLILGVVAGFLLRSIL